MKSKKETLEDIYSDWLMEYKIKESIAIFIDFYIKWLDEPFYHWKRGYSKYDCSGSLEITSNRIVDCCFSLEAVSNAYTGVSIATYISGCGISYQTVEDAFRDELQEMIFTSWLREFVAERPTLIEQYATESKGLGIEEKVEFIISEDIVGFSNIGLEGHIHDIIINQQSDIFEQITTKYNTMKVPFPI